MVNMVRLKDVIHLKSSEYTFSLMSYFSKLRLSNTRDLLYTACMANKALDSAFLRHNNLDYSSLQKKKDSAKKEFVIKGTQLQNGYAFEYTLCSNDNAKFINFCGLCVDADSLIIALGLNPRADAFIGIMSFKEIINLVLFGDRHHKGFSDEGYRLLLEDLKLYSGQCDIVKIVEEILVSETEADSDSHDSIILKILADRYATRRKIASCPNLSRGSDDLLHSILVICMSLSMYLESLGSTLFYNYIVEGSVYELIRNSKLNSAESTKKQSPVSSTLEVQKSIYIESGFSSVVLDALVSYGMGMKHRKKVYSEYAVSSNKESTLDKACFAVLSSLGYLGTYTASREILKTQLIKSFSFNILDLLYSVGWEHDLFFAYEVEDMCNSSVMVDSLVKKFSLQEVLNKLGISPKEFREYTLMYQKEVCPLRDMGALYLRKVQRAQYQFSSFSSTMLHSSGKLFAKISKRLIKKL